MYTDINFKSAKDLKDAFMAGRELGTYQPGGMFASRTDGECVIEGPHYPQPHKFYVQVRIAGGVITHIKQGTKYRTAAELSYAAAVKTLKSRVI